MYVPRGFGQLFSPAQTIAQTIQQVEGYYPGSLAYTNHTPGNLIYVGQAGATQGAGGFAAFPSYDAGYQALLNQIQNYASRGLTIQEMMNLYAPAGQGSNNPTAYASMIASALGTTPDTSLSDVLNGADTSSIDTSADTSVIDLSSVDPTVLMGGALLAGFLLYQLA